MALDSFRVQQLQLQRVVVVELLLQQEGLVVPVEALVEALELLDRNRRTVHTCQKIQTHKVDQLDSSRPFCSSWHL